MSTEDERVGRLLRKMDRRDQLEQKLGVSQKLTKLRDERALREMKRREKEK